MKNCRSSPHPPNIIYPTLTVASDSLTAPHDTRRTSTVYYSGADDTDTYSPSSAVTEELDSPGPLEHPGHVVDEPTDIWRTVANDGTHHCNLFNQCLMREYPGPVASAAYKTPQSGYGHLPYPRHHQSRQYDHPGSSGPMISSVAYWRRNCRLRFQAPEAVSVSEGSLKTFRRDRVLTNHEKPGSTTGEPPGPGLPRTRTLPITLISTALQGLD